MGEEGGGGDNAISNPIRNCRQPFGRHSRNEHKILRLFRRARYLASCTPRIERSKYPPAVLHPPVPSHGSLAAFRLHLLTRASAFVVFLTLLFGVSTSFASSFSSFSTWLARMLLCSRTRSRLSYLASLLGEDLSCGTSAVSHERVPLET